jgi:hypothetical protein
VLLPLLLPPGCDPHKTPPLCAWLASQCTPQLGVVEVGEHVEVLDHTTLPGLPPSVDLSGRATKAVPAQLRVRSARGERNGRPALN